MVGQNRRDEVEEKEDELYLFSLKQPKQKFKIYRLKL